MTLISLYRGSYSPPSSYFEGSCKIWFMDYGYERQVECPIRFFSTCTSWEPNRLRREAYEFFRTEISEDNIQKTRADIAEHSDDFGWSADLGPFDWFRLAVGIAADVVSGLRVGLSHHCADHLAITDRFWEIGKLGVFHSAETFFENLAGVSDPSGLFQQHWLTENPDRYLWFPDPEPNISGRPGRECLFDRLATYPAEWLLETN